MIQKSTFDKLKSLCDEYYKAQEKCSSIVEKFNESKDDDERNELQEQLEKNNKSIKACADEFTELIKDAVETICMNVDNPVVEYMKQKVMSPFDTSADESRYNRINRLRDLDEYIDLLKKI